MKDNNENLENQYEGARFVAKFKKNKSIFIRIVIYIIIIKIIFNAAIGMVQDYKEYEKENEIARIIEEMNLKINYVTNFYAEDFNIEELEEIEFDNGIKIPTLGIYKPAVSVQSFSKKVEDNIVANNSPVINIMYTKEKLSSFMILKFKSEVLKRENYKLIHCDLENNCNVYARKEVDDYYSYLIVKEYEITYGVTYGDLKIYF